MSSKSNIPVIPSRKQITLQSRIILIVAVIAVAPLAWLRGVDRLHDHTVLSIIVGAILLVAAFMIFRAVVYANWQKKLREVYYPQYDSAIKSLVKRKTNLDIKTEDVHLLLAGQPIHPTNDSVMRFKEGSPFNDPIFDILHLPEPSNN